MRANAWAAIYFVVGYNLLKQEAISLLVFFWTPCTSAHAVDSPLQHNSLAGRRMTLLYLRPTTLDEAVHALAESRGSILSGGTDFFPSLGDRSPNTPVVDISAVAGLKGIHTTNDTIQIGGRTTWQEILEAPLPRGFDGLKAAAREVGSVQIQNVATVAGNLCNASPAADGIPPLLALDAEVVLVSVSGVRRIPLASFVLGNRKTMRRADEILSAISVPRRMENSASTFLKLGARRYLVISIAMVACKSANR